MDPGVGRITRDDRITGAGRGARGGRDPRGRIGSSGIRQNARGETMSVKSEDP